MNLQTIMEFLNAYKFIIGGLVVVIILCIYIIHRQNEKRRLRKRIDGVEVLYNELISIPVLFKINKATGLSKMNPKVEEKVLELKQRLAEINTAQEDAKTMLDDLQDLFAYGKLRSTEDGIDALEFKLEKTLEETQKLDQDLEVILEQETAQRQEINVMKERFRGMKMELQANQAIYHEAYDAIIEKVRVIEQLFSVFEEWMYASDFQKAKEVSDQTRTNIEYLEMCLQDIPNLYKVARGHIPQLLDEISRMYYGVKQNDIFVDHLEVPKTMGILSEVLKDDLISLSQADVGKSKQSLSEVTKRLEQLGSQMQKEEKATEEVRLLSSTLFETVEMLDLGIQELKENSEKVEKRFNFEGHQHEVVGFEDQLKQYEGFRIKIERMIKEEKLPASTILISLSELNQDVSMFKEKFEVVQQKVQQANADEIRARQQLLKLHLIYNDVQVRIRKRAIPSVSTQYEQDLRTAKRYTDNIVAILDEAILDVANLNKTVDEAIDYIYKLHNNVNNLVGVVDMCENAIVYANKYRAYVSDIDSELTRAELSFTNGEYTQALTTIISAVERYKPNLAYEEMIRDNAKSAR